MQEFVNCSLSFDDVGWIFISARFYFGFPPPSHIMHWQIYIFRIFYKISLCFLCQSMWLRRIFDSSSIKAVLPHPLTAALTPPLTPALMTPLMAALTTPFATSMPYCLVCAAWIYRFTMCNISPSKIEDYCTHTDLLCVILPLLELKKWKSVFTDMTPYTVEMLSHLKIFYYARTQKCKDYDKRGSMVG